MNPSEKATQLIRQNIEKKEPALDLSNLGLKEIPKGIKECGWLEVLILSSNNIAKTTNLSSLENLRDLDLSNNKLKDLSGLSKLTTLEKLYLGGNRINNLNWNILKQLKNLHILDLNNNNLVIVPPELFDLGLSFHWSSVLQGNPLAMPPLEVINQGDKAISAYLGSLDNVRPLNQVKVLLIGDGGAGKTSLLKSIFNRPFDQGEKQTHGINIQKKELEVGKEKVIVNFWDFGGQEIMHATHKFFLTKRSIYLLVIDGRKEDKTEYWLKHVETFGGDSPVIIVINKIDENQSFDLNRNFLLEKYPKIEGFARVSCKERRGLSEFLKLLNDSIHDLEMRKTLFAKSWFEVMASLNNMTEDYISYEQYYTLCIFKEIKTRVVQDTLLQFLHDLGIVLHFKKLKLHDTQVLNPLWLTNAVYRVINSPLISENGGYLHLEELNDILNNPKWGHRSVKKKKKSTNILDFFSKSRSKYVSRNFYYPENKFLFIIRIMQEFELCFRIDDETYIVPDLLPIEEKRLDFDFDKALKFVLDYDFLPTSILPRLMIQTKDRVNPRLQWRTGVVLDDPIFKVRAVIKADKEDKKILIWVKGEKRERQREFLTYIRNMLKSINDTFEKIEVKELIPIPSFEDRYIDYQGLVGLEEMGKEEYTDGILKKTFLVDELLNGIEDPLERIDAKCPIRIFSYSADQDENFRSELLKTLTPLISKNSIEIWNESFIQIGQDKRAEALKHFESSDVVVFLLSRDFFAEEETLEFLDKAIDRHRLKEKTIIPILVRTCSWKDSLIGEIAPVLNIPINAHPDADTAWEAVYEKIKTLVLDLKHRAKRTI